MADPLPDGLETLRAENARLTLVQEELARTLDALRASDDRLRLATNAAQLGIWEWDIVANRVVWDATKHAVFGLEPGVFAGTREAFFELVHPDDRAMLADAIAGALHDGLPYRNEFRLATADGSERWIANLGEVMRDDAGRPLRMIGVVFDNTARRVAEDQVRLDEHRFRAFVESMREWVWTVDRDQRVTYSNTAVESVLGYRVDEVYGRVMAEVVHPDDMPLVTRVLEDAVVHRRGWEALPVRCRHKRGDYRLLEWYGMPTFDAHGRLSGFRGYDRDITARGVTEQVIRRADRVESVAGLAGGVAHHFNNALCVFMAHAYFLAESPDAAVRASAREILDTAERSAELVRQLLLLSGHWLPAAAGALDVPAHLISFVERVRREVPPHVQVRADIAPAVWSIALAPRDLDLLLMHVVTNAVEAMPLGGTLTITARNVAPLGPAHLDAAVSSVPCVEVTVTDTGVGMSDEVARRAWEPFFSTKPSGTEFVGLGLSVAYSLATHAGGHIELRSAPAKGTRARIVLPAREALTQAEPPQGARVGSVTVLVTSARRGVRYLSTHVLHAAGYRVLDASSVESALELARRWEGPLDILVSDLTLEDGRGDTLATQLRVTHPAIQTLFLSEASTTPSGRDGLSSVLHPPFTPVALLNAVRGAIALRHHA